MKALCITQSNTRYSIVEVGERDPRASNCPDTFFCKPETDLPDLDWHRDHGPVDAILEGRQAMGSTTQGEPLIEIDGYQAARLASLDAARRKERAALERELEIQRAELTVLRFERGQRLFGKPVYPKTREEALGLEKSHNDAMNESSHGYVPHYVSLEERDEAEVRLRVLRDEKARAIEIPLGRGEALWNPVTGTYARAFPDSDSCRLDTGRVAPEAAARFMGAALAQKGVATAHFDDIADPAVAASYGVLPGEVEIETRYFDSVEDLLCAVGDATWDMAAEEGFPILPDLGGSLGNPVREVERLLASLHHGDGATRFRRAAEKTANPEAPEAWTVYIDRTQTVQVYVVADSYEEARERAREALRDPDTVGRVCRMLDEAVLSDIDFDVKPETYDLADIDSGALLGAGAAPSEGEGCAAGSTQEAFERSLAAASTRPSGAAYAQTM